MKNVTYKLSTLTLALVASFAAIANDTVRVVITKGQTTEIQSTSRQQNRAPVAPGETCVATPHGEAQWCLSGNDASQMRSQSAVASGSPMQVVTLPSYAYSATEVAQHLNAKGVFGHVEADLEVSSRDSMPNSAGDVSSSATNDPAYSYAQRFYFENAEISPSGSDIVGMWDAAGMSKITNQASDAPDVLVIDSEFVANDEVSYHSGRNFSTTALVQGGPEQKRSDDYTPPAELAGMCQSHGLNVSSIIAAKMDNGTGMAGVTNNVRLHAIKALTCGNGWLSDVADALWWATGRSFDGVTPYAGKPGSINMSISAAIATTDACPAYLQEAIDAATAAGWTIVVAAGNYNANTAGYVPAKCDNVITVAAVDRSGGRARFSNYGEHVDIVAQGEDMAIMCNDSTSACYGQGTSYAAPLVTAALTVTKYVAKATPAQLTEALSFTARTDTVGSTCGSGVCGDGLMDATKLFNLTNAITAGTANRLEHVLSGKDTCEQEWYLDHFGNAARLCEMYKLTMMDGITREGISYRLYSVSSGEVMSSNALFEGEFTSGSVVLHSLTPAIRDYAIKVCQNDDCGAWFRVDVTQALKPASCS